MSPREPILASTKLNTVLERYPDLVDVLVELSPAFRQLRNPILRRVQARLVTVAHAARIAGLEPTALVLTLNAAAGIAAPTDRAAAEPSPSAAAISWPEDAPVAVELDVRPMLARGEEPFGTIVREAARTPVGQIFRLRAPFEPFPLYDALAKQGFGAASRQLGPNDWEVSFLRERPGGARPAPTAASAEPFDWDAPNATVTIDVSELVPPEPMIKILEALARLPAGGTLLVRHVRRPIHLYARLDELGCRHATREPESGRVELLIQKPLAQTATA
jgi:uncharacterized protein (DUF2249 family)